MTPNNEVVTREEFEELRRRVGEAERRLSDAEDRLHRGDITLALIDKNLENINTKLGEVSLAVQALKEKPAKRWEAVVTQVLQWAIALLLGYIALKLRLS